MIDLIEQMILWALAGADDLSGRYLTLNWPDWATIAVACLAAVAAASVCVSLGRTAAGAGLAGVLAVGLSVAPAWCLTGGPIWRSVLLLAPGCAFALASGASPKALIRLVCRIGWLAVAALTVGYEPSVAAALLAAGILAWTVGWAGRLSRPLTGEVTHGAL